MKSEKVTDIFGNEKVVHYDDYGNKVGESQVERGFLGFGEERSFTTTITAGKPVKPARKRISSAIKNMSHTTGTEWKKSESTGIIRRITAPAKARAPVPPSTIPAITRFTFRL